MASTGHLINEYVFSKSRPEIASCHAYNYITVNILFTWDLHAESQPRLIDLRANIQVALLGQQEASSPVIWLSGPALTLKYEFLKYKSAH